MRAIRQSGDPREQAPLAETAMNCRDQHSEKPGREQQRVNHFILHTYTYVFAYSLEKDNTYVYGVIMTDRLGKQDWLDCGLKALAEQGAEGLGADRLARRLKVSRGSFYWHFADVGAFAEALLRHWREQGTTQIIRETGEEPPGPSRLAHLMRRAFSGEQRLERAIRSWAATEPRAAAAVTRVDRDRIAYLESLMRDCGVPPGQAAVRARFLYWAWLGRIMMHGAGQREIAPGDADGLAGLLLT